MLDAEEKRDNEDDSSNADDLEDFANRIDGGNNGSSSGGLSGKKRPRVKIGYEDEEENEDE